MDDVVERAWCCPRCCDFYWFDADLDAAECAQCTRPDRPVMCVEYVPVAPLRAALDEIAFAASYGVATEPGELTPSEMLGRISRIAEDALAGKGRP